MDERDWDEAKELGFAKGYRDGAEAMRAECMKVCEAHDAERDRKSGKRSQAHYVCASEEAQNSIRDEERGEKIAAEELAKKMRALPVPVKP